MGKIKGIYCLEGFWFGAKDRTSVFPVLDLLDRHEKIRNMYHRCATREELCFMLQRWGTKSIQKDYPILYLAAHGQESRLDFGGKAKITLDELAELLEGKCERTVVYFGSCSTLGIDKRHIKRFLEKTHALAAIGYCKPVGWLPAASLELLVLSYLKELNFDTQGMKSVEGEMKERFGKLTGNLELEFRVVLNERQHFPCRRNIK